MELPVYGLTDDFLSSYKNREPKWGPLGYIVYKRTYSRDLPDGTTEEWWQTIKRVVKGTFYTLQSHCESIGIKFDHHKANEQSKIMYDKIFNFKFLPPGRGLWMMGTDYLHERKNGAGLNNCAFVSTEDIDENFSTPFVFTMDMLMMGVGVGFDVLGAGKIQIQKPIITQTPFVVEDSREGWVSLIETILKSFVGETELPINRDYSKIRKKGEKIKGFGGVSSGYIPLEHLVQDIISILDVGDSNSMQLTSMHIVDIECAIGKCVIAGNLRRSAMLALGLTDDSIFCSLKDRNEKYEILNNPYPIPEYAKIPYDYDNNENPKYYQHGPNSWRWASNNSTLSEINKVDFENQRNHFITTGEPGNFWIETARKYGRLIDPPNWKDKYVKGLNPCLPEDQWITLNNGESKQVKDLIGKQFIALIDGVSYPSDNRGFYETGYKEVFKITTSTGHTIRATGNHPFKKFINKSSTTKQIESEWTELSDLEIGDKLILSNHRNAYDNFKINENDFKLGWLLGNLIGDGHIAGNKAILQYWGDNKWNDLSQAISYVKEVFLETQNDTKGSEIKERDTVLFSSAQLKKYANKFGISNTNKLPNNSLEKQSISHSIGFIQGLFDADGSPQGNSHNGVTVRLSSIHNPLLEICQRLLSHIGINSTIYKERKPPEIKLLPDSNRNLKEYQTQGFHELVISRDNLIQFKNIIGFSNEEKKEKLSSILNEYNRPLYKEQFTTVITSVQSDGYETVYDCTIPEAHCFDCNGFVTHNCGEQTLESQELCCLVESYPSLHDSYQEFQETLKYAFIYAKAVTLIPTNWKKTNAIIAKNRRIGTSQTGVIASINRLGKDQHLEWCDKGYNFLQDWDQELSGWLLVPRSIKTTSIKPSGSVSLLPGVPSGIHWPHSEYYIRRMRISKGSYLVPYLIEAGYSYEEDSYSADTYCFEIPVKEENFDKGKSDITIWDQLEIAKDMQYYWADNSVSVTVTFKEEEIPDLVPALEKYQHHLKAVSFLKHEDHVYAQPPYEEITKEEYEARAIMIKPFIINNNVHDSNDKYCDGEACQIEK